MRARARICVCVRTCKSVCIRVGLCMRACRICVCVCVCVEGGGCLFLSMCMCLRVSEYASGGGEGGVTTI